MNNIIKTEAEYLELERLAMRLGIPLPPTVRIKLESTLNGKNIGRYEDRSHTYTRNYWNLFFGRDTAYAVPSGASFGAGYLQVKGETGSIVGFTGENFCNYLIGTAGNAAGIVVGTGVGAESFESYMLTTKVLHGTTSNKLSYVAQTPTTIAYTAGSKLWTATLLRMFNNNSGGAIVITEVGIINSYGNWLISRDLLASSVTVANGGQLTVTYTISRVFPA